MELMVEHVSENKGVVSRCRVFEILRDKDNRRMLPIVGGLCSNRHGGLTTILGSVSQCQHKRRNAVHLMMRESLADNSCLVEDI